MEDVDEEVTENIVATKQKYMHYAALNFLLLIIFYMIRLVPVQGNRKGYIPSSPEDFDDGGAFPEIHIVQYPLNMGKPGVKSSAIVAVDVDEKGQVRFDAIVKQGANKDKIVQTSLADMAEKEGDQDSLVMPNDEEAEETAERTKKALEGLLDSKITKAKSVNSIQMQTAVEKEEPKYIRYTPNPDAPG